MYNTIFNVKYNDIQQELIYKLKNKTPEDYKENSDEEYEYSTDDVLDICKKLYIDELLSVFYLEDLDSEKINEGMKYIYDIMMTNTKFKQIITDMEEICFTKFIKNDEEKESIRKLILISLFSQDLFYILHKCICQQMEVGNIDDELLVEIRKHSIDLIKNNFGVN